jgi:hypothetical protein
MFRPATAEVLERDLRLFTVVPLEPHVHGPASALRWVIWTAIKQLIRLYLVAEQGTPGGGVFTANLCAAARRDGSAGQPPR